MTKACRPGPVPRGRGAGVGAGGWRRSRRRPGMRRHGAGRGRAARHDGSHDGSPSSTWVPARVRSNRAVLVNHS
ncbi:hypothetical protein FXF68_16685 [Actinomadura decatromicini]|uniref:Uncharacterized protein n=1 Tax=Actinomadura decatromicini TaxID=2604572 RepID=A0A5D3FKN1_9ACTN|nr:hypothetical protein FXF68_16685 [Actinomadura decatromicini]